MSNVAYKIRVIRMNIKSAYPVTVSASLPAGQLISIAERTILEADLCCQGKISFEAFCKALERTDLITPRVRAGKAVPFVTQYEVEFYQRIEHLLDKKLPLYKCEEDEVKALQERGPA
uniref:EF-hand domain-containing protein n=2 Tax=Glossina palpalis gambiensis TaxID=67801 RepID=A0A1B0BIM5_9MUSC